MRYLPNREKQGFLDALKFLANYGFSFSESEMMYFNKYNQSIQISYEQLDPNFWIPKIYINNNYDSRKRFALDVYSLYEFLGGKKSKSLMYMLSYIIKHEINTKNSIFGINLSKEETF